MDIASNAQSGNSADFGLYEFQGGITQVLFLRLDGTLASRYFHFNEGLLDSYGHAAFDLIGVVDCTVSGNAGGSGDWSFDGAANHLVLLGNSFDNGGGGSHVVRILAGYKIVMSNNDVAGVGALGTHMLKQHAKEWAVAGAFNPGGVGTYTEHLVISNNSFDQDTAGANTNKQPIGLGVQDATVDERTRYVIFEGNWVKNALQGAQILMVWCSNITIRNNLIDATTNTGTGPELITVENRGSHPDPDKVWLYNNTVFSSRSMTEVFPIVMYAGTNIVARNNIAWCDAATSADMLFGTITASANSSDAQVNGTSPNFASATPSVAADFQLASNSYGVTAGAESVPVFDDFFWNVRNLGNMDIGFHAYTTGSLPESGGSTPLGSMLGGLG